MDKLVKAIEKLTKIVQRKLTENDGWFITVSMVDNGWIIDLPSNNSEGRSKVVVVNPDAEDGSKAHQEAVMHLLYEIRDAISEHYSKHNEWNLKLALENTNPKRKEDKI